MGYPKDLLISRAVVEPGKFALIPPQGLVNNVIPGFDKCVCSIIASPKYGASFVQYIINIKPEGGTTADFGGDNRLETFIFCIEGSLNTEISGKKIVLEQGGYLYCTPAEAMQFKNISNQITKVMLYKQVYMLIDGHQPRSYYGNINDIKERVYDDMENVFIKDLLPVELGFDMNMHILTFEPGGCHPFVETHVQEHGAYLLSGEGMYYLGDRWIPVKKDDFIWFGPYVPQAVYCAGRERLTYIYSKDCNRDAEI